MTAVNRNSLFVDLAQALQEFWEDYAGIRPSHVWVVADKDMIAMCLEGVLSPAEWQMASTLAGSTMLEELEKLLLDQAKPYLKQLVEGVIDQECIQVQVRPDVANGSVLAFFRLE